MQDEQLDQIRHRLLEAVAGEQAAEALRNKRMIAKGLCPRCGGALEAIVTVKVISATGEELADRPMPPGSRACLCGFVELRGG